MRTMIKLCAVVVGASLISTVVFAQTGSEPPAQPAMPPPPNAPAAPPDATTKPDATTATDAGPLASLSWLAGCWQGTVNQREFREQWLPLRGGVLIGAGQSVLRGRMQDYQFLRLEPRPDGVYFSQFSGDRKEASFRLSNTAADDGDTIYTFSNTGDAFPARLVYRRGTEGWLYETIEGTLNGAERKVVYPLRRVDCESGEFIRQ